MLRGEHQLDLAALAALERLARRDPQVVHRLVGVVASLLALRRGGDEEARVEAARASRRGDPVAEVGELARGNVEVFLLEQLAEWAIAPRQQARRALGADRP